MLLSEQQTKYYLEEMIHHYENKEHDAQQLSWTRSEADAKKKAFEDMKIVLFGDDNNGHRNKST